MSTSQLLSLITGIAGGGGGSGGSSGGGTGGSGLSDLLGLIGGGVDAYQQGQAADKMKAWLDSQSAKMEGYMNPNTPEYSAMWEEMSRKDAASGRNSQYGPRTSDFLANVAKAKAQNTMNFTTGTSRAYADALNQRASRYAGLSAALQHAATGGGSGGGTNYSGILNWLNGLGGSSTENMTNQDWLDLIGSEGQPIDYGSDATDESAVWEAILNEWGF